MRIIISCFISYIDSPVVDIISYMFRISRIIMGITKTLVIDDAEKLASLYEQERKSFINQQLKECKLYKLTLQVKKNKYKIKKI